MKVVKVRWNDCRLVDDGSYKMNAIPGSVIGEDVGWLVKDDGKDVGVALTKFSDPGKEPHFRSISVIPRCQILSIKTLYTEPRKK